MRMFRTVMFVIINLRKPRNLYAGEWLNVVYLYIIISDISENEQVSLRNVILSKNKQTAEDYSQNDTIFIQLKNEW